MKKFILILFLFNTWILSSCGNREGELWVWETVQFEETSYPTYMKINFELQHPKKEATLESVRVNHLETARAYIINDEGKNWPESYERTKLADLPYTIKSGERYSIVLVSEGEGFSELEQADFHFKIGSKEITHVYETNP